jgi:hypothetical protein
MICKSNPYECALISLRAQLAEIDQAIATLEWLTAGRGKDIVSVSRGMWVPKSWYQIYPPPTRLPLDVQTECASDGTKDSTSS